MSSAMLLSVPLIMSITVSMRTRAFSFIVGHPKLIPPWNGEVANLAVWLMPPDFTHPNPITSSAEISPSHSSHLQVHRCSEQHWNTSAHGPPLDGEKVQFWRQVPHLMPWSLA